MMEARPDELFAVWLGVPDGNRNQMDAEFREISEHDKGVATGLRVGSCFLPFNRECELLR